MKRNKCGKLCYILVVFGKMDCKAGHRLHLIIHWQKQIYKPIPERPLFTTSSPKHPFGEALQTNMA